MSLPPGTLRKIYLEGYPLAGQHDTAIKGGRKGQVLNQRFMS